MQHQDINCGTVDARSPWCDGSTELIGANIAHDARHGKHFGGYKLPAGEQGHGQHWARRNFGPYTPAFEAVPR